MEIASVKCVMNKDTLNIEIEGDVDHHTAKFIRSEIDKAIFYYRPKVALLNVGKVDFMDSSGLGLIMGRYALMKELGGDVVVCDPCAGVERVIKLAGMDRLVRIEHAASKADSAAKPVQAKTRARRAKKEVLK